MYDERVQRCEGDSNAGVGYAGVVVVSAWHVGGTRGSGNVFSTADMLWMSVVHGMRGVDGVCEMGMCLARPGVGGEGGEWMRGLGFGFNNPVGTGRVLSVFWLRWCMWRVGRGIGPGSGGVVLCLCEFVCSV